MLPTHVHDCSQGPASFKFGGFQSPAGTHAVSFDATGLTSGVYFYRLEAGEYVETKRMVVVK